MALAGGALTQSRSASSWRGYPVAAFQRARMHLLKPADHALEAGLLGLGHTRPTLHSLFAIEHADAEVDVRGGEQLLRQVAGVVVDQKAKDLLQLLAAQVRANEGAVALRGARARLHGQAVQLDDPAGGSRAL